MFNLKVLWLELALVFSSQVVHTLEGFESTSLAYFGLGAVNQNVYVFLGRENDTLKNFTTYSERLLKLDLTHSFNTSNIPWEESKVSKDVVLVYGPSCTVPNSKTKRILCFGGKRLDTDKEAPKSPFTTFDSLSSRWEIIGNPEKESPSPRFGHSLTTVSQDKSYLYGGLSALDNTSSTKSDTSESELWFLDSEKKWKKINPLETETIPGPRYHHTLTKINDHQLVLIGGQTNSALASVQNVHVYDTHSNAWELKNTNNFPTSGFHSHSTVLWGEQLIVFGGTSLDLKTINNKVYSLDPKTWSWSVVEFDGSVEGRYGHGAVLVGDILLMFFGSTEKSHLTSQMLNLKTKRIVEAYTGVAKVPYDDGLEDEISVNSSNHSQLIFFVICLILAIAAVGLYLTRRIVHQSIDFEPLATTEEEGDFEFEQYQNQSDVTNSIKMQTYSEYDPHNDILYRPFSD